MRDQKTCQVAPRLYPLRDEECMLSGVVIDHLDCGWYGMALRGVCDSDIVVF